MQSPISTGWLGPDEIRRGASYVARFAPMRDGEAVAMTAATVRVLDNTNAVVSSGSATVASNVATYTIPGAVTTSVTPGTGWTVEWTATLTGVTPNPVLANPAEVVLRTVEPCIGWTQVLARHRDLDTRLATDDDVETAESRAQDTLDGAWWTIKQMLRQKGRRPLLIVDSYALAEPHMLLTLARLFRDLATAPDSAEWLLADRYDEMFRQAWDGLTFEEADPSDYTPTGVRVSTSGTTWLGSSGAASFRPSAGTDRRYAGGGWS